MSSLRATWGALGRGSRIVAVTIPGVLVVAIIGVSALALTAGRQPVVNDQGEVVPSPIVVPSGATPPPLPPEPSSDPEPSLLPSPSPLPPTADPVLGTDGRLTLLLLGSDFRPAHPGNRTDAILVVSVEPTTGRTAGFSLPRDMVDFPLPNGKRYSAKINSMYQYLQAKTGKGGLAMRQAVARAYDLEVDSYVFIGFEGFKRMIRAVGGVTITLAKPYYDPYYWVNPRRQGWGLPAGKSHLDANEALIFARSRKGDNDFGRARRQQQLIMAVLAKVRQQPEKLPRLLAIASDTVRTDMPLAHASRMFEIVARADIGKAARVVFGPTTYADGRGAGAFAPNLPKQRNWIRRNFPAAVPFGSWPPAVAASSPGASPAP